MEQKINVSNPEAITYATEELGYTILGGTHRRRNEAKVLCEGFQCRAVTTALIK